MCLTFVVAKRVNMRAVWFTLLLLLGVGAVAWSFVEAGSQDTVVREGPPFAPPAKEDPSLWAVEKIRIVKMAWSRERDTALITIWLENKNDFHVRNVMLECDFLAADGFRFHRKRETPIGSFPAKKTTRVARINFGFINRQVHMVDCLAIDAVLGV
jgi:hypothetical protein